MRIHSPQITGSAANTNIVLTTITSSISVLSSSFATTASYWSGSIINAATASYILNAQTASYVASSSNDAAQNTRLSAIESVTGSYATTSSFGAYTASNDLTNATQSSRLSTIESVTGSYATTGSNVFKASQTVSGSLTITNDLIVLGSSSIQYITSSQLNISNNLITVNTIPPAVRFGGFAVVDSGSSPQTSGSLLFDSTNDQWVFVHQSNADTTSSVLIMGPQTYNNLGNETYPTTNRILKSVNAEHLGDSNITDTGTKVSINSNTEVTGSLTSTGGFTGSLFGSASFALTASYISGSGGGVGFPFSGSAIITGSLFVSGSTISGSFKGDGSQITGLTAGGKIHTQTSAASTWTVSHNLRVQYPNVTVYDNNNNVIIPQTIVATDLNTLTLTFGSAVAGYAIAGIGGIINVQGRTTQQYFTASTTWSFAHNLGDRYVSLQAFDDAFEMMIPTTIRLVDFTSSLLLFDSASSGYAVATIGGDLPAISSSYAGYTLQVASSAPYSASWVAVPNVTVTTAQTASYANNFTVGGTLTAQTINVQTITSSIEYVTGSTRNGSIAANTHQFTGSVSITGSATTLLSVNNSVLFVSASGNVGIGTSSPTTTLTVNGPITVLAGNNIYLTNTKLGGDASYNFDINYNTGGTPSLTWYGGTTTSKFAVNSTGAATFASSITAASPDNYSGDALKLTTKAGPTSYYMNIYPTDAGAGGITWTFAQKVGSTIYDNVMVMRLGNLLIGRTDAGLSNGSGITLAPGSVQVESNGYLIYGNRTSSDGLFMGIRRNNVDVGSITVTTSATAFNTSSDYRLKTDFKDYNGLSLINSIKTYNYAWTIDNTRAYGVKAHELQELLPYMVFGEKDATNEDNTIKPQAVDYSKLVPVLVKAIQELSAKNTTLEERLTALENK
jgi:hypothetical protein